jgi:hypothetical protein
MTVFAALALCGCYKERVVTTPQDYLSVQRPSQIALTRQDGTQAVVFAPRLVRDTIFGMTGMSQSCMLNKCMGQEVTIGVTEVQSFKVRELDKTKTLALLGVGGVGVVVVAAALSGKGPEMGCVGLCSTNPQTRTGVSIPASRVLPVLNALARRH